MTVARAEYRSSALASRTDLGAVIEMVGEDESTSRSDDNDLGVTGFGEETVETTSSAQDRLRFTFGYGVDADESIDRSVDRYAVIMSADDITDV